jgi:hypothetical protein
MFNSKITQKDGEIFIESTSSFLVSDFGIEPPCMVFMCVRDKVDLVSQITFTK